VAGGANLGRFEHCHTEGHEQESGDPGQDPVNGRAPDDSLVGPAEVADLVASSSARDGFTNRTSAPASDGPP
jgi:hypothetical protein